MKVLAVIPARFASTRFPGKPLAMLDGKPVIQWVWDSLSAIPELAGIVVATDDERIVEAVQHFGGRAMMTSAEHRSGTDRCGEVLRTLEASGEHYDVVVNVQGDEPFTRKSQIQSLIACFENAGTEIATLKTSIRNTAELTSPNNVKVICTAKGRAVYFSRQPIPYLRGEEQEKWLERQPYYKHIGIYAFRSETLKEVVCLPQSALEVSESLEQLRWLENGYAIEVRETESANIGIDTPEDLAEAERHLKDLFLIK